MRLALILAAILLILLVILTILGVAKEKRVEEKAQEALQNLASLATTYGADPTEVEILRLKINEAFMSGRKRKEGTGAF